MLSFGNKEFRNLQEQVEKNKDDLMKRMIFMNNKINDFTNTNDIYVYLLDGHGRTLLTLLSLIMKKQRFLIIQIL